MKEAGIDIRTARAKSIEEIDQDRIGIFITLCAEEVCPVFPREVTVHHWPFEDPAVATGSELERLAAFRRVRDAIRAKLEQSRDALG